VRERDRRGEMKEEERRGDREREDEEKSDELLLQVLEVNIFLVAACL
jgi:hypothetical protein